MRIGMSWNSQHHWQSECRYWQIIMQASSNYKVLLTINKGIQFIKNRAMVIFYARMKHAVGAPFIQKLWKSNHHNYNCKHYINIKNKKVLIMPTI